MQSSALCSIVALFTLFLAVLSSDITTYTDAKCTKSFSNLDAVNGYPDGVCTPLGLGGSLQSFQIAKLDPGCAVTLYGADSGPLQCSSDLKIVADFATCYNSSWIYFSIDGCFSPSSSSIVLPTASESSKASSAQKTSHTGIIVGGIVGGVSLFAVVFGVVLFCLRRRAKPLPPPPSHELPNDRGLLEAYGARLAYPEKLARSEMWGQDAAMEIGRNSLYTPPAELPGDSIQQDDKKGINPLIKIHMVR